MACHEELIEEMPRLEKMSNAARLKLAKKRRQKQLKRYTETERNRPHASGKKRTECKINFEDEALLHDAVQQNNVEEGELWFIIMNACKMDTCLRKFVNFFVTCSVEYLGERSNL